MTPTTALPAQDPGSPRAAPGWQLVHERLSLALLLALALGAMHGAALANLSLGALTLLTALDVGRRRYPLHRDALCRLAAATSLYLCLHAVSWPLFTGLDAGSSLDGLAHWMKFSFLLAIPVAYWVGRRPGIAIWLLAALCIGYFARVLGRLDWDLAQHLASGEARATFGDSANNFGTWSGVVFFALVALAYHQLTAVTSKLGWWANLALLFPAMLAALAGLVFSQARGAWLALLVAACGVGLPPLLRALRAPSGGRSRRFAAGIIGILLVVAAVLVVASGDIIAKRMGAEQEAMAEIASGRWEQVPPTSIGLRVQMAEDALGRWAERPLTGWGLGSVARFLAESGGWLATFRHYHDSYLMILVELGVIGLVLLATGVVLCVRQARRALRRGLLPPSVGVFLGGSALLLAAVATVSEPLSSYRGPFVAALLAGIAYSSAFAPFDKESY